MEIFGKAITSQLGLVKCIERIVLRGHHPYYPHLNQEKQSYATLCGRDTVQYENRNISQEMLIAFLEQNQIHYRTNNYMTIFKFRGHRIVAFNGGRFLIHEMTHPQNAMQLINQLFG